MRCGLSLQSGGLGGRARICPRTRLLCVPQPGALWLHEAGAADRSPCPDAVSERGPSFLLHLALSGAR